MNELKEFPIYSDLSEWYHGDMSSEMAEKELKACNCNCFMVRRDKEDLFLSLLNNGEIHHFNIEIEPGSFKLKAVQQKFSKLAELVAFHCHNGISLALGKASRNNRASTLSRFFGKGSRYKEIISDKAEAELRACGQNSFLIREEKGTVMMTVLQNGEIHHFRIEQGPEWCRLQASASQHRFRELADLVTHCTGNVIKLRLGAVLCKSSRDAKASAQTKADHKGEAPDGGHASNTAANNLYEVHQSGSKYLLSGNSEEVCDKLSSDELYSEGDPAAEFKKVATAGFTKPASRKSTKRAAAESMKPAAAESTKPAAAAESTERRPTEDLTKYIWYHGSISDKETECVFDGNSGDHKNHFLVRQRNNKLILSMKIRGYVSHATITSSKKGYSLIGKSDFFQSVPDMIKHYTIFPIEGTQLLGRPCDQIMLQNFRKSIQKLSYIS